MIQDGNNELSVTFASFLKTISYAYASHSKLILKIPCENHVLVFKITAKY